MGQQPAHNLGKATSVPYNRQRNRVSKPEHNYLHEATFKICLFPSDYNEYVILILIVDRTHVYPILDQRIRTILK